MICDIESGRVLLVDDDLLVRTMAGATLRQADFVVTEADSGEQALRLFEQEHFDLVLLDVMMPGMDGYAVCERLRRHADGAWLPILMLTGLNDTESIQMAYRSGATDFITKPINWTLLVHRVRYGLRASLATESVMRSRESLARAQRLANLGSWEWWPSQERIACSEELVRILGLDEQAPCRATPEALLRQVRPQERAAVQAAREAIGRAGTEYQLSYTIERRDGAVRTVFEQAVAMHDSSGQVLKVEGITQDITERVEAERRIRHLAYHDTLTGLANRLFFGEMATSALERTRRLGSLCAVLHIDLDRFKSVNDALGDTTGDELLRAVAERLLTCTRSADLNGAYQAMPGPAGLARVGGDAFTVLLVDMRSVPDTAAVAQRLLRAIAQPVRVNGRDLVLTASIGIAIFPRDGDSVDALLRHAEQAMYAAKAAGRGGYRFFNEEMNATASAKLEVENDLRNAIVAGQLRLYFQPKVNAANGTMSGAEALVRWQHPQRGLVPPGEFIPLAEETGLIVPIGDWVLQQACEHLQRWAAAGLTTVPLSINLSSPSFMQNTLVSQLAEAVRRTGLQTHQLTLEVTESLLMQDIEGTISRLHALREQGFGLSLDDFGTGYSSLSYLKRFPIDELKIDRSFVRDVMNGGRDRAIVASIIDLGREFGLTVVAEGVETPQQADFLLEHGCTIQQGFLFARPMPAEQFTALLARPQPFDLTALSAEPQAAAHAN